MSAITASRNGHGELPASAAKSGSVYDRLAEIAGDARDELARLDGEIEAEAERHREAVAVLAEKRRRLRGLLKHLGEDVPSDTPGRKRGGQKRSFSAMSLQRVLLALQTFSPEDRFGIKEIREANDDIGDFSKYYSALDWLRDQEIILRVGDQRPENGVGSARKMYKLKEPAMIAKLLSEVDVPLPRAKAASAPGAPSMDKLVRYYNAIRSLGKPEFSAAEITEALGLSSTSGTRKTVRWMVGIGYLQESRKERRSGPLPTQLFIVANPDVIEEMINKETVNA